MKKENILIFTIIHTILQIVVFSSLYILMFAEIIKYNTLLLIIANIVFLFFTEYFSFINIIIIKDYKNNIQTKLNKEFFLILMPHFVIDFLFFDSIIVLVLMFKKSFIYNYYSFEDINIVIKIVFFTIYFGLILQISTTELRLLLSKKKR